MPHPLDDVTALRAPACVLKVAEGFFLVPGFRLGQDFKEGLDVETTYRKLCPVKEHTLSVHAQASIGGTTDLPRAHHSRGISHRYRPRFHKIRFETLKNLFHGQVLPFNWSEGNSR
jgi:hypothetical protein